MIGQMKSTVPPAQPPGTAPNEVTVCITIQGGGTFVVYPKDQGPGAGQPAGDIEEALSIARGMLEGTQGSEDAAGASARTAAEADALFQGGFNSVRGG